MHELLRSACLFARRLLRFFTSFQVELRGNYSIERLQYLYVCNRDTPTLWTLLVVVVSPFPCLVLVALVDSIPLAAPENGSSASYLFWIRDYISIALMARAIMEQFRINVPGLKLNSVKVISMSIISSAGAIAFMIAVASLIGFPLPFALVVGIPVWLVVLIACFGCCFGHSLKQDRQLLRDLISYTIVLVCQVLLTFIYPAYLYGFSCVGPSSQKFYVILLPLSKIIAKNWICYFLDRKFDLMPQNMIFNVDVFNALYVSSSVQNSRSTTTMLEMIALDAFFGCISIRDISKIMRDIIALQNKIPQNHPLRPAKFLDIALQIAQEDPQTAAPLVQHRYTFLLMAFKPRRTTDQITNEIIDATSKKIVPIATISLPRIAATTDNFTPLNDDEFATLANIFSLKERRKFVQRAAQVLFVTEFVILVEYTEVIVPFIYCMYTTSMHYLPNREYYAQTRALDSEDIRSMLSGVAMFGFVELLSLLILGSVIQRKVGLSVLHILSFVLDRGWRLVQSNLFLWIFYTITNSLEHNGADFSWSFSWLKDGHP